MPDPVDQVTAQAPGRVNLIGEHTDYNDGLCLPVAIPYTTRVSAGRRGDDRFEITSRETGSWSGSLDDMGPGRVEGWAAYPAGTLWALTRTGRRLPGLDLRIESDVPVGAGLSSSAALEASVAVAVTALLGEELDDGLRTELVEVCRRAEGEVVGAPTGGLDQTAVLRTPPGGAVLLDFAAGSVDPVALPLAEAGLRLIVVDTQVSHALVDGGYGDRRRECEQAASALGLDTLRDAGRDAVEALDDPVLRRRARHIVTENARVLAVVEAVGAADWVRVGELFAASHASMRDDFEISCDELDVVVATAVQAGALGARMTGGGFGGSAIALVPAERVEAVRRAVDNAFVAAGFKAPAHLDGTPGAPADVVRDPRCPA